MGGGENKALARTVVVALWHEKMKMRREERKGIDWVWWSHVSLCTHPPAVFNFIRDGSGSRYLLAWASGSRTKGQARLGGGGSTPSLLNQQLVHHSKLSCSFKECGSRGQE